MNEDDQAPKPVDIRSRVAAFEQLGSSAGNGSKSGPPPPLSLTTSANENPEEQDAKQRTSTPARSYQDSRLGLSADVGSHRPAPLAPRLRAASSSSSLAPSQTSDRSSPLGSASSTGLPPFSAAYKGPQKLSPHSSFDLLARTGSVKSQESGTSLPDFAASSLPKGKNEAGPSVSGKVPLPPTSPVSVRVSSPAASFASQGSPALSSRSLNAPLYAASSANSPQLVTPSVPLPPPRKRSSTGASSSSSQHPLDDDDDEVNGGYGLILHPTLLPTASPSSSRPPSRVGSQRSAPPSPVPQPARSGLAPAQVRVQAPTPSPERRIVPPTVDAQSPRPSHLGHSRAPSLPPRTSEPSGKGLEDSSLAYVAYKPRVTSGPPVAKKVPPPPGALNQAAPSPPLRANDWAPSVPPRPVQQLQSMNNESSSGLSVSPITSSPLPGHRSTKSGPQIDPRPAPGFLPIQPPPNRTRSSSAGPGGPKLTLGTSPSSRHSPRGSLSGESRARSMAPADGAARSRYEAVWDREVAKLSNRRHGRDGSTATIRPSNGLSALTAQFGGTALTKSSPIVDGEGDELPSRLPAKRVAKVWSRSRLREDVLSQIWVAALSYDLDGESVISPSSATAPSSKRRKEKGLSKEAFIRGLCAIDAELYFRAERRAKRASKSGTALGRSGTYLASNASGRLSPVRALRSENGPSGVGAASASSSTTTRRRIPPPV